MKIEPRGKYAGVKVHLDGDEAEEFLKAYKKDGLKDKAVEFQVKLGKKISKLLEDVPNLFKDRTEEQIKASMEKDLEKIHQQQKAMGEGKDWKKV